MVRKSTLLVAIFVAALTTATPAFAESVHLKVEGMTCRMCPKAVEKALERTEGVKEANASYKNEMAVVEYDSEKTNPRELIRAIGKAGYKASTVEQK